MTAMTEAQNMPKPCAKVETPHKGAPGVYAIVSLADGYERTICYVQAEAKGLPLANADLIAGAPELLEALAQMLGCHDVPSGIPADQRILNRAYAAIARAEGRCPNVMNGRRAISCDAALHLAIFRTSHLL